MGYLAASAGLRAGAKIGAKYADKIGASAGKGAGKLIDLASDAEHAYNQAKMGDTYGPVSRGRLSEFLEGHRGAITEHAANFARDYAPQIGASVGMHVANRLANARSRTAGPTSTPGYVQSGYTDMY